MGSAARHYVTDCKQTAKKLFYGDLCSFWMFSPAKLDHWKTEAKVLLKYIMGPLKLPAGEEVQEWCVLGLQREATFDV